VRIGRTPAALWENPSKWKDCVTHFMDDAERAGEPALASICRAELNGHAPELDDLRTLALTNYGHFTTMQTVGACVRGLDRHFDRLDRATHELFGTSLDFAALRAGMRRITAAEATCALRVTVFSRAFQREQPAEPSPPDVLITSTAPRAADRRALRLKSFCHTRALPHIKHIGTFDLHHHRRLAQQAGFDDALFVGAHGAISEASIWNVGFVDADGGIVWPDAPALDGVSMQLLRSGLEHSGVATTSRRVTRADLGQYRCAFLTNSSCPVRPIASIDDVAFDSGGDIWTMLEASYAANPLQPI